jgi:hypothetical protein
MDLGDSRLRYALAAVLIAILVPGYGLGWCTGTPGPVPPPQQ